MPLPSSDSTTFAAGAGVVASFWTAVKSNFVMVPLVAVLPQTLTHWLLELSKVTPAGSTKSALLLVTAAVGTETPGVVRVVPLNSVTLLAIAFSTHRPTAATAVGVDVGPVDVGVAVVVLPGVGVMVVVPTGVVVVVASGVVVVVTAVVGVDVIAGVGVLVACGVDVAVT